MASGKPISSEEKPVAHMPLPHLIITALLLLACAPIDRFVSVTQNSQAVATGATVSEAGDYSALTALEKLGQLPGYRLESRQTYRSQKHNHTTIISEMYDTQGNIKMAVQALSDEPEIVVILQEHIYRYRPHVDGWVDVTENPAPTAYKGQALTLLKWLLSTGIVSTQANQEAIQGRAATRYKLQYITANMAQASGNPKINSSSTNLQGALWIDDQSGALLKAVFLLYEANDRQPVLEYTLEVSQIGQVEPIPFPSPIINPDATVAATATALAWSLNTVTLRYLNQPVTFEISPGQVIPATAPNLAEVSLALHRIPQELLADTQLEPFLTEVGRLLKLSIPDKNLVTSSIRFQLEEVDPDQQTIYVDYFFEVDLQDVNDVELILSAAGNPVIMPLAVEP